MLSVLDYSFFVEWLLHVIFIDPFRWQFAVGWTVLTYDPVSLLSLLLCVVIKYLLYKQWVTSATSLFKSFSLIPVGFCASGLIYFWLPYRLENMLENFWRNTWRSLSLMNGELCIAWISLLVIFDCNCCYYVQLFDYLSWLVYLI